MNKNYYDFKTLEFKSDEELKQIIKDTEQEYIELQNYIDRYEQHLYELFLAKEITYFDYTAMLPKVEILIKDLANLESYIRKAGNLLYNFDKPSRKFDKMNRNRKLKFNLDDKKRVTPKLKLQFKQKKRGVTPTYTS